MTLEMRQELPHVAYFSISIRIFQYSNAHCSYRINPLILYSNDGYYSFVGAETLNLHPQNRLYEKRSK